MPTQTFNCTGAGTTITPLPRPYYCCGWGVPPLSFSGKYTCTTVGGPPTYPECDATDQPFTLELVSDCYSSFFGGYSYAQGTSGFFIYMSVNPGLCASPDGSDGVPASVNIFQPGFITVNSLSCSYDKDAGTYSFYYNATSVQDYGSGHIVTIDVTIDTVTMP